MSHFLRELLGLLHGLLHNLRHCCRWLLRFALLKFIDLVTVVGMVRVIGVEEIKFWIVDLILTDSCFKLRTIPVKGQEFSYIVDIKSRLQLYKNTMYNITDTCGVTNLATKLAVLSTMFRTSGGGYIIPTMGLVAGVSSAATSFC